MMQPPVQLEDLLRLYGRAFLEASYRSLLGRMPDRDGMAYFLGLLEQGRAREQVLAEIAASEEARRYGAHIVGWSEQTASAPEAGVGVWPADEAVQRQLNRIENLLGELAASGRAGAAAAARTADAPAAPWTAPAPAAELLTPQALALLQRLNDTGAAAGPA